jgi:hypothetical protein
MKLAICNIIAVQEYCGCRLLSPQNSRRFPGSSILIKYNENLGIGAVLPLVLNP